MSNGIQVRDVIELIGAISAGVAAILSATTARSVQVPKTPLVNGAKGTGQVVTMLLHSVSEQQSTIDDIKSMLHADQRRGDNTS